MNCDQVFDVLTRGAFPAGEPTDEMAEAHLRTCYECRQLAEALRPALDLFHESLSPADRGQLPAYCGAPSGERDLPAIIEQVMSDSRTEPPSYAGGVAALAPQLKVEPRRGTGRRPRRFDRVVGGGLVCCAIALFAWSLATRALPPAAERGSQPIWQAPLRAPLAAISLQDLRQLEQLHLPTVCLSKSERGGGPHVFCCTHCHSAVLRDSPPLTTLAAAWDSCRLCHPAMAECF